MNRTANLLEIATGLVVSDPTKCIDELRVEVERLQKELAALRQPGGMDEEAVVAIVDAIRTEIEMCGATRVGIERIVRNLWPRPVAVDTRERTFAEEKPADGQHIEYYPTGEGATRWYGMRFAADALWKPEWKWRPFKIIAAAPVPCGRCAELQEEVERLKGELDREDSSHLETIDDRDAAEEAISRAYRLVVGHRPEWSSAFSFEDAVTEIDECLFVMKRDLKTANAELTRLRSQPGPVIDVSAIDAEIVLQKRFAETAGSARAYAEQHYSGIVVELERAKQLIKLVAGPAACPRPSAAEPIRLERIMLESSAKGEDQRISPTAGQPMSPTPKATGEATEAVAVSPPRERHSIPTGHPLRGAVEVETPSGSHPCYGEQAGEPVEIPNNAYWNDEHGNFYSIPGKHGMGVEFYAKWYEHRSRFPTSPPKPAEQSRSHPDRCPTTGLFDCPKCSGEYCESHGTDPCDCDVVERHAAQPDQRAISAILNSDYDPEPMTPGQATGQFARRHEPVEQSPTTAEETVDVIMDLLADLARFGDRPSHAAKIKAAILAKRAKSLSRQPPTGDVPRCDLAMLDHVIESWTGPLGENAAVAKRELEARRARETALADLVKLLESVSGESASWQELRNVVQAARRMLVAFADGKGGAQ